MCYAAIALVTDLDAGVESGAGVGQEEVVRAVRANLERLHAACSPPRSRALPDPAGCTCSTWADGIDLTYDIPTTPLHAVRGRDSNTCSARFLSTGTTRDEVVHRRRHR